MSKLMQEIEPFDYTYSVKDLFNKSERYFSSLHAVREFIWKCAKRYDYCNRAVNMHEITFYDLVANDEEIRQHDWKTFIDEPTRTWSFGRKYKVKKECNNFLIRNHLGAIISADELIAAPKVEFHKKEYIPSWKLRRSYDQKVLKAREWKKGNANKIKRLHCTRLKFCHIDRVMEYSSEYYSYYRRIKTTQERRMNALHEAEYRNEYNLVRRSRCGHNLPSSWDDIYASVYKSEESWKTNSKRRKQWKPRDDKSL